MHDIVKHDFFSDVKKSLFSTWLESFTRTRRLIIDFIEFRIDGRKILYIDTNYRLLKIDYHFWTHENYKVYHLLSYVIVELRFGKVIL